MSESPDLPIKAFTRQREWNEWLAENYDQSVGIWLQLFKKGSGVATVTYDLALEEALCYGWIDSQRKSYDEQSYLQKFTPRRPRSVWSKRNRERVERLIEAGRMQPAGLAQVEAAKADGRWQQAYDAPSEMTVPDDFLRELAKNPEALAFYETLNKANTYAIAWRLRTTKTPETRERRKQAMLEKLARGERLHD